jgi:hypothetical protein
MLKKTTKSAQTNSKNSASSKKLGLRRETLVSLSNEALSQVAGGVACNSSVSHPL